MGCFDRSPQGKSGVNVRLIHCEHTFGAWWVVGCSGTYFKHAQTCDNVCVQSATQWTASVYFTRAQTCDNVRGQSATQWTASVYFTHAQTCDNVRVQSATQWTASVHTLHMLKPVITFVFKVLRKGLLRTYFTHAQASDNVRVQSATQWTASVHTLHMSIVFFSMTNLMYSRGTPYTAA